MEEPESTPPEPADTETQEPDREPTTGESEAEEPDMDGERTVFETGTAKDSPDISQTVRRSSRTSHPPQRFGEQKF